MNLGDTVGLSLRNLRQSKLRTALTTLGVSIGIASLTGMVSLGVGLQDQIIGRFQQSGLFDTLTVTSTAIGGRGGFPGRGGGREGGRVPAREGSQSPSPKLDDAALKQISELENVREAYPDLRVPVEIVFGDFSQGVTASGVPMSSKGEGAFQMLSHGAFFTGESDSTCMLSLDIARQISAQDPGGLIGRSLTLSYAASRTNNGEQDPSTGVQIQRVDRECKIVGVVERPAGQFPPAGGAPVSGVMLPIGMARSINDEIVTNVQALVRGPLQPKSYGTITVKVKQAQATQDVAERIRGLGYSVFSINDALRGAKSAFIILDIVLSLIGSIALAVSALGIVNTMVMSILERTREIGIMKAIGGANNDIRRIFLIEASVIGALGGVLGIVLGWLVGQAINLGANLYIQSQGGTPGMLFSLPLWLVVSAIVFSILVSLIAGSYPASRAAKLDPIHALRHD